MQQNKKLVCNVYTIRMVYHMTENGVKAFSQVSLKQLNEEKKGILSRCTE